jgi:hypothetical protein
LVTLSGETQNEHYGRSMAGVGDINGDGLADLLVGDCRQGWFPGERRCHLYYGSPSLGDIPDVVIYQAEADTSEPHSDDDDHFGEVVAGGNDVNADGFDDISVTSPFWFLATGKTYLYHGGCPFDLYPDVAISGYGSSWMTWFWATGLRGQLVEDVNGDGYDELVCLVEPLSFDGGAYVYFGGAPMDSVHDLGLQGPGYPDLTLGASISHGDLNGDGYGDLAAGSYGGNGQGQVDAAWVYFGGPQVDETADIVLGAPDSASPYSVCIPGDLNGDGYGDVAVASAQRAYVYFGSPWMDGAADLSFSGRLPWGSFSLDGGDINGDGFADLIAAEVSYYPDVDEGRLAVYFGGAEMDTFPDIEIWGPSGFGETVSWIGDMTGDGWPEFAVSNPSGPGEIYIYTMGEVSGDGPNPSRINAGELRIVPNPSNGMTMIGFDFNDTHTPIVGIYDLAGHLVRRLDSPQRSAGKQWFSWDGRASSGSGVATGIYVVKVENRDSAITKRIVIAR